AVAVIFGTSVSSLSLVLGLVTYMAPMNSIPPRRRCWPFVLPAALLVLVAGFSAQFNWLHALMLLVMGGAFYSVWDEPDVEVTLVSANPGACNVAQTLSFIVRSDATSPTQTFVDPLSPASDQAANPRRRVLPIVLAVALA